MVVQDIYGNPYGYGEPVKRKQREAEQRTRKRFKAALQVAMPSAATEAGQPLAGGALNGDLGRDGNDDNDSVHGDANNDDDDQEPDYRPLHLRSPSPVPTRSEIIQSLSKTGTGPVGHHHQLPLPDCQTGMTYLDLATSPAVHYTLGVANKEKALQKTVDDLIHGEKGLVEVLGRLESAIEHAARLPSKLALPRVSRVAAVREWGLQHQINATRSNAREQVTTETTSPDDDMQIDEASPADHQQQNGVEPVAAATEASTSSVGNNALANQTTGVGEPSDGQPSRQQTADSAKVDVKTDPEHEHGVSGGNNAQTATNAPSTLAATPVVADQTPTASRRASETGPHSSTTATPAAPAPVTAAKQAIDSSFLFGTGEPFFVPPGSVVTYEITPPVDPTEPASSTAPAPAPGPLHLSPLEKLFVIPTGLDATIGPHPQHPLLHLPSNHPGYPSTTCVRLSPETQKQSCISAIDKVRELATDCQEYVLRLEEIRLRLADVARARRKVWQVVRERAVVANQGELGDGEADTETMRLRAEAEHAITHATHVETRRRRGVATAVASAVTS